MKDWREREKKYQVNMSIDVYQMTYRVGKITSTNYKR